MDSKIFLYTERITARLEYTADVLFTRILRVNFQLSENRQDFEYFKGPKIRYGLSMPDEGIYIPSMGLMQEPSIRKQVIPMEEWEGIPVLFPSPGDLPFDLFSATFYMLSRYEEYLPFTPDRHGRFPAEESIAFRKGFLDIPVVDVWAEKLKQILQASFPSLGFPEKKFVFQPTLDIDNAWAYLHKSSLRCVSGALRDILSGRKKNLQKRLKVVTGEIRDPYDSYDWLQEVHHKANLQLIWFFLSGSYGKYDKNISVSHPAMKDLIQRCKIRGEIGIHPSYQSAGNAKKIMKEKRELERVAGSKIIASRQHYLRIRFPETFRDLIAAGITQDYSLGYPSQPGFRAGTCTPFPFYDLPAEKSTSLILTPFQVMERTFTDYLALSADDSLLEIIKLLNRVKQVKGTWVSIFHNESLGDGAEGLAWRGVYERMISEAQKGK